MLPSFDHATRKRRQKKQSIKHYKQPDAYITNNQYEEHLEQRKAHILSGKKTYAEAIKFAKKVCLISNSRHLDRIKRNIFQKSVNGGKHILMFFEMLLVMD